MTEEQIKQKFNETYPNFMRGDEPLSPYFDIWEYAIEIATEELQEELGEVQMQKAGEKSDLVSHLMEANENYKKQIEELKQDAIDLLKDIDDINKQHEEEIKSLEAQIEKMKNCRNCKNEKIEGACGHFTQVGWCKNWELAE